jgi:tetratricopeptide (TPR) repeat protein
LNQLPEAIELLDRIVQLLPGSEIAGISSTRRKEYEGLMYHRQGGALMKEGRFEDARESFLKAMELTPDDERNYANIGVIHLKMGDLEGAMHWFREAITVDPSYVRGYYNLGTLLLKTGKAEQAVRCFQQALEVEPEGRDSDDIRTNMQAAEDNIAECRSALIAMMSGSEFMDSGQALNLLSALFPEDILSSDATIKGDGTYSFILHTQNGSTEALLSEGEILFNTI